MKKPKICTKILDLYSTACFRAATYIKEKWWMIFKCTKMSDAKDFLGKEVEVVIDRPLGSKHPEYNYIYPINYGYIPNTTSGDGDELDAFVLDEDKPWDKFKGVCVAVIHRTDDDDDKLIVVGQGRTLSDEEIEKQVEFQEKWFKHEIIRKYE